MEKLLLIGIDTRSMLNSALKLDYEIYSTSYFSTQDTPTIENQKIILKEILLFKGSKESKHIEITNDDEIVYSINLDPIYLQDVDNVIIGSIINIKDITEKVKLENMRTDFVANVSHELKTPLTSISGFVETLKLNENIDLKQILI